MTWIYTILISSLALASDAVPFETSVPNISENVVVAELSDVTEKIDQTYPFNADGRLSVSNINGPIVVEAWDLNEVRIEAVKSADSAETLAQFEVKITASPERIRIETDYQNMRYGQNWDSSKRRSEVSFKLSVPRGAVLNEIEAVNGSIMVSNFVNMTKVSAVNGTIKASNLRGNASLSTVNGPIECDFDRVEPKSQISLSTVNGRVILVLPSDANATIKADTLNGSITNDFGLPVRKGEYVGRDMHGKLGSGDAQIKMDTVNGRLSVTNKDDGKTSSTVTDLLPESGNDDRKSVSRANRDVERAVRASRAEAAAAAKNAKIEMEKIAPELEKLKELKEMKIDIPTEAIKEGIEVGLKTAAESLAAMGNFNFEFVSAAPRITRSENKFAVNGRPKITVNGAGCDVNVRGTDGTEVRYTLTEISRSRMSGQPAVSEDQKGNAITLTIGGDVGIDRDRGPRRSIYRLDLYVPKASDVSVRTLGDVRVSGVDGKVDISGEENSIDIRDANGTLSINSDGGQVRVIGYSGEFLSETDGGNLYLDGRFNSMKVEGDRTNVFLTMPPDLGVTLNTDSSPLAENIDLRPGTGLNWSLGDGARQYSFRLGSGTLTVRASNAQ